jgi:ribonuclease HII
MTFVPPDLPSRHVAGVDEAGRGPLAGPVIAAAVMLDPENPVYGLKDSKQLTHSRREALYLEITRKALAWAVGRAGVEEIDRLNILQASLLAMQRAVVMLNPAPHFVLVDGNQCPRLDCPVAAVVRGDSMVAAISAASIIAKVTRDREMVEMDLRYPGYGLARHKGYPSREHLLALQRLGVTPLHRRSYAPVRRVLETNEEDGV